MSLLNISFEKDDLITLIKCRGMIKHVHEEILLQHLELAFRDGARSILFDWSDISYFDSMGLECILAFHNKLAGYPARTIGVIITDPVLVDVYKTLGFQKLIPLFIDKQNAIETVRDRLAREQQLASTPVV